ncbi:MAG TPA: hypothetical protein VFN97_11835, partial [Actinospica sp.]|nr:hypothetical protein [Actinospica sp.]
DDYAQFGWGLSAAKLGQFELAVEHLAVAAAMRPDVNYYTLALRGARATARAQTSAAHRRQEAKKSRGGTTDAKITGPPPPRGR